ncbi:MAG TPA: glycosyltransferase family 4 protein [Azospirillum sp.]
MRILAISHRLDLSGAPIALYRLLASLAAEHEITVLSTGGSGPLKPMLEAAGIAVPDAVNPGRFDVTLCNTALCSDMVLKIARRVPVVWWLHEGHAGHEFFVRGRADATAFRHAHHIVFPTLWQARNVFAPWLGETPWSVVPMGVPVPPRGQPAPFERRPGECVLAHVASVSRRKGQDLTIDAVRRLDDPGIRVFFVGEPAAALDPMLRDGEGERFVRTGPIPPDRVAAYMEHCDALLLPTRDDLIPLVIQEAMLLGTCVLASDFGAIPETVRHGRSGLLSPAGDSRVLAGNIAMIRRDAELRAALGARGRTVAAQRHDFGMHRDGMLRVLRQVAAGD